MTQTSNVMMNSKEIPCKMLKKKKKPKQNKTKQKKQKKQ